MTEVKRENAVKIEGRQYVVVGDWNYREWPVGTVTTLVKDDGSDNPLFEYNNETQFINMGYLMLLAETEESKPKPVISYITEEQYAAIEVGDTIVIRDDLKIGSYGKNSFTDGMLQEKGKQLTVKSDVAHTLGLRVEESSYNWTQQMIAEVIKKEIITEKPEFIPEIRQIYATDSMILKVNSISENKIYGAGLYSMMGYQLREEGDSSWSASTNRTTPWTPATDEQKIKLLTAMAEHGDATDSDLDLLSELMPLDNPELEVGAVYMVQAGEKWLVRKDARSLTEMTLCFAMTPADKYVDTTEGHLTGRNYRKALPHEVVKLETAEKEHGCEYKKATD